jgi:hypothetical protein
MQIDLNDLPVTIGGEEKCWTSILLFCGDELVHAVLWKFATGTAGMRWEEKLRTLPRFIRRETPLSDDTIRRERFEIDDPEMGAYQLRSSSIIEQ